MSKRMVPSRGDIVICDFSPTVGHEQSGRRPAVVISGRELNDLNNLITVCPITSTVRGSYFEVPLKNKKTKGVIMTYHMRTVDFVNRKCKIVDKVDSMILDEVIKKINVLIKG